MLCDSCGVEMVARVTKVTAPYIYELGGLPGIGLVGLTVWNCSKCGMEYPVIPRLAQLHRVIADVLLRQETLLRGDELRFLRKNAGFSAEQFAALLEVSPSHLSRVENGKTPNLGASTDKLAKAIVAAYKEGGEPARGILLAQADTIIKRKRAKSLVFTLQRNVWRSAA